MLVSARAEAFAIGREVILEEFQPMSAQYLIVTDRQTDGRTDGQTDESNLNTALCTSASRGKNRLAAELRPDPYSSRIWISGSGGRCQTRLHFSTRSVLCSHRLDLGSHGHEATLGGWRTDLF